MKKMVVIGYGGHAESVIDSIRQRRKYEIVGYTDKCEKNTKYPYLGSDDVLHDLFEKGIRYAAICVGYLGKSNVRDTLYRAAKNIGFQLPVIIDKTAILADNVLIGEGSYIGKGVIVNAGSTIGRMCIINSGAVIEHQNKIGDFTHVSVNTVLCGNVSIEDHTFIGANATIIQELNIHAHSMIGAGAIVLKDVPEKKNIYGVWDNK